MQCRLFPVTQLRPWASGEIKAVWPGKQVTLVDVADDVLGERYRPDLKAER